MELIDNISRLLGDNSKHLSSMRFAPLPRRRKLRTRTTPLRSLKR